MTDLNKSPNIDDLTPEEASRIIHSHRKVRYGMPSEYSFVSNLESMPRYLLSYFTFKELHAGLAVNAKSSAIISNHAKTASKGNIPSYVPTNPIAPPSP